MGSVVPGTHTDTQFLVSKLRGTGAEDPELEGDQAKEQWSDGSVIDTSRDSTVRVWEIGRQPQNDQPTVDSGCL